MLNVTDQYCISPATSKGGFLCHSGDLSRKCHLCLGSQMFMQAIDLSIAGINTRYGRLC